ncbi:RNA polymerase subunit sigma-24 [Trinickia dabaoshanensis]|uniref:RNA polymerase subunit sigma-24 n=1 Tax=Trinickia dabaoshanensis TaxID=564714 RepID=A0A2N7VLM9_9BURK|nr:sigma-70 family RNA polymerase sigma factor [Trinickia dabaoshanensis]PMS18072.1 RNA polymerase subunit sigma-24 [Trinickia dabaoshanensis]
MKVQPVGTEGLDGRSDREPVSVTQRASMLAELLSRVARHDVAAFAALYRETQPLLSHVASKILRRREWTEEVLQESYVKIWGFAGTYDPARASALTWMLSVVRNQALDQLRRHASVERETELAWELGDDLDDRSDVAIALDVKRALTCLARLAPAQRQTISLAYLRECSHAQVAGMLGMPLGTVKARIRLGLVNLKRLIEAPVA